MSGGWLLYRWLTAGLGAVAPAARWGLPGPERRAWPERMGHLAAAEPVDAWIHSASMGEAVAAAALADALCRRAPASRFHFSATTLTGRARLAARGAASLAPLDTAPAAERFIARIEPRRLFVLETEVWPHWLMAARRRGIPVAAISARLSRRSLERLAWLGRELRALVGGMGAVLCQSEEDRRRWLALGAPPERTAVVGNLQLDALPRRAPDVGAARGQLGLDPLRPLLVLASLRPGEARPLAGAWASLPSAVRDDWQVVAVPRHPRGARALRAEAAALAGAGGPPWRWDERVGVLADYYAVADLAFVGGSLVPVGGHNPLEPAACGVAVLMGPHTRSQQAGVELLAARGALVQVERHGSLPEAMARLLRDPADRIRRGAAGRQAVDSLRGVADRAVASLEGWNLWPPA